MYVMNLGLVLVLSVIPVVTELFLIRNLTVNHILIFILWWPDNGFRCFYVYDILYVIFYHVSIVANGHGEQNWVWTCVFQWLRWNYAEPLELLDVMKSLVFHYNYFHHFGPKKAMYFFILFFEIFVYPCLIYLDWHWYFRNWSNWESYNNNAKGGI